METGVEADFQHIPVLLDETLALLRIVPGGAYIDATLGGGGHTAAMLEHGAGRVLGIDRDPAALAAVAQRLGDGGGRLVLAHGDFRDIATLARRYGFQDVDGVLFDLGVSSYQLDTAARGFSFQQDAPLDMRMDPGRGPTAAELINTLSEEALADLIYRYGEERMARRIAKRIVEQRRRAPLRTTTELAALVAGVVGRRGGERLHPATRTFQALRIAVNDELGAIAAALPAATDLLAPGGRLAVISFHSLEDRIVKEFIRREAAICLLPPRLFAEQCPHLRAAGSGARACIYLTQRDCDYTPRLTPVTPKPVTPSAQEVQRNPRSRSAKLRVAERRAASGG